MSKILYAFVLTSVILFAGCTTTSVETPQFKEEKSAVSSGIPQFNSEVIPKTDENVYYVVVGSVNNDTVVNILYLTPSEAFIGSRPWSTGQKCISWDASYDWMSSNVKTKEYIVKLKPNNNADISITDTFITKDQKTFEDYKSKNCS